MARQRKCGKSSRHAAVRSSNVAQEHVSGYSRRVRANLEAETCSDVTVAIARNMEEIETFRAVWQEMQDRELSPKPNVDIDRYISVIEANRGEVKPHAVLFKQGSRPVAMVVSRSEKRQFSLKLGTKALLRPRLKCLNVVYGGVLGQPQGRLCSIIISELSRQLKSQEFDVACFNHLKTGTAMYEAVRKTPGFFTRGHFPTVDKHWRMSMPDDMDQFYKACSRGHRGSLRRVVRKFEQEYPGRDNFAKYTSEGEVDDFVRTAAGISSKTYQYALGVGLVNDEQTTSRIRTAAKHGWFHGGILFAGDKPCAFQLGLRYKKVYYLISLGYDPALNRHRVGTYLFLKVLESLCADPSIEEFDFYFGDAEYKKRYGTTNWYEGTSYIFAPRLHPISINALRCAASSANATLAYVVNKVGARDWIKQRWRNALGART